MRSYVLHCKHGRFLHHVAKVTCKGQLSLLAAAQAGLHKEYLTAYGSPGKSGYHTGVVIALILVAGVGFGAQQFLEIGRFHRHFGLIGVIGITAGCLAAYLADLLLKFTHARFTCVVFYDRLNGRLGDGQ